jgi:hypothetical protein
MTSAAAPQDLYLAIGRVAPEGANTEQILKAMLRSYFAIDEQSLYR